MLTIIEVQCSGYLGEDDILPFAGRHGRVLALRIPRLSLVSRAAY